MNKVLATVETHDGPVELTQQIFDDYKRLYDLFNEKGDVEGLDGICISSCWGNGIDTAREIAKRPENKKDIELLYTYYSVSTARSYEIL